MCILHYHHKKYDGHFGRILGRTSPRNTTNQPSSPQEIEPGHRHSTESHPVIDTEAHVNTNGAVLLTNRADSDGNDGNRISDVHTISRISSVTEYDSTHHMPCQHTRTSIDFQEESIGDVPVPPSDSTIMPLGDNIRVSMKENESYQQTTAIHSIRNPACGTNIAIAPWINTQENVAYNITSIDFNLRLETQV